MDELPEFCARVLGRGDRAIQAAGEARSRADDRMALLAAAVAACRARDRAQVPAPVPATESRELAEAVAGELAVANARLPQRQREALALRELLGLSHSQVALVIGIDAHAVAPLLARARLRLRRQLRAGPALHADCPERDRSLRLIAQRQDSEPVHETDTAWLMEHLRLCPACNQAHAAMLEASVCYRAWRVPAGEPLRGDRDQPAVGPAAGP